MADERDPLDEPGANRDVPCAAGWSAVSVARPAWATITGAAAVAWAALLGHNEADLPIPPWALENVGPLLVTIALVVGCVVRSGSKPFAFALLAWALLNAAGAILTVLPLPMLPFVPEQSAKHYAWHALYLVGQAPLILVALRAVRAPARRTTAGA